LRCASRHALDNGDGARAGAQRAAGQVTQGGEDVDEGGEDQEHTGGDTQGTLL
jgi:hypothetical protein